MNMFTRLRIPKSPLQTALTEGRSILVNGSAETTLAELAEAGEPVRVALIDPPYNRRTKFHHYGDSASRPEWLAELRMNCERLHGTLRHDGSLWMHIDDAEMFSAREMLDDVFGRRNFVATIVWQKTVSRDNRTAISTSHEYILVYARDKTAWLQARHKLPATGEQHARYRNLDDDPRGPWTSGDLTAKAGPGRRAAQFYEVETPSGRIVRPAKGTCWRFTRERLNELIKDNRIAFGDGNKMPRLKRFLSEVEAGLVPDTWWEGKVVGTADSAKRHLKSIFPDLVPFETPKPEELVSRILQIASDPGDLVVDCYGGSGTTASVAQKMGRQWLVCEREVRTFNEFTQPRIERVIAGEDQGGVTSEVGWAGGGDFLVIPKNSSVEIRRANSRQDSVPMPPLRRADVPRQQMESLA